MFVYVCFVREVIVFVDWPDRGLIYIYEKNLEMHVCLWPEFDCPEVTHCGWQDIKIQLLWCIQFYFFLWLLTYTPTWLYEFCLSRHNIAVDWALIFRLLHLDWEPVKVASGGWNGMSVHTGYPKRPSNQSSWLLVQSVMMTGSCTWQFSVLMLHIVNEFLALQMWTA